MSLTQTLDSALQHHQRGELGAAERLYREVLERAPEHAGALNLLGVLEAQSGQWQAALGHLTRAARAEPDNAEVHYNLALALASTGQAKAAIERYRRAVALRPDYPEALLNLGNLLIDCGEAAEAEACLRRAAALAPGDPVVRNSLGAALLAREAAADAVEAFRETTRLAPDYPEAHNGLGLALSATGDVEAGARSHRQALALRPDYPEAINNLAMALHRLGSAEEALERLRAALALQPDYAAAHSNLGLVLAETGRTEEAEAACRKAIDLSPAHAQAHNNLGSCLNAQGRYEEAEGAFRRALELEPAGAEPMCNLGNALTAQGRLADAESVYRQALSIRDDHADAHYGLATALLAAGDFAAGFGAYDWRWETPDGAFQRRAFPQPAWDGAPLAGRTLLVWGEQGVGDEIMFASLLPDLAAAGGRCLVECDPRLVPLYARSFPHVTPVARRDPPDPLTLSDEVALQLPIGSLARLYRLKEADFPRHGGYLVPPPGRREALRGRYRPDDGALLVGISWRRGKPDFADTPTAPLERWDAVLRQPGVRLVSLQYGDCAAELAALRDRLGVDVLLDHDVDPLRDMDAFAAQVAAMDLVVSVDNTTVHTAGALGVPVWTLLTDNPDWRWQRERRDSPWYPSMTLFRPSRPGGWAAVLADAAAALAAAVTDRVHLDP